MLSGRRGGGGGEGRRGEERRGEERRGEERRGEERRGEERRGEERRGEEKRGEERRGVLTAIKKSTNIMRYTTVRYLTTMCKYPDQKTLTLYIPTHLRGKGLIEQSQGASPSVTTSPIFTVAAGFPSLPAIVF